MGELKQQELHEIKDLLGMGLVQSRSLEEHDSYMPLDTQAATWHLHPKNSAPLNQISLYQGLFLRNINRMTQMIKGKFNISCVYTFSY